MALASVGSSVECLMTLGSVGSSVECLMTLGSVGSSVKNVCKLFPSFSFHICKCERKRKGKVSRNNSTTSHLPYLHYVYLVWLCFWLDHSFPVPKHQYKFRNPGNQVMLCLYAYGCYWLLAHLSRRRNSAQVRFGLAMVHHRHSSPLSVHTFKEISGPFPAILGKGPRLESGENKWHFGNV